MYEVTTQELMVFVVLGFTCGIFSSFFLARFFEVVHTWRMVQETVVYLLLMCVKISEDVAFLGELKKKQMVDAEFTAAQIRKFQEVDDHTLTNWKDSVILSLIKKAPPHFRGMLPFKSWDEAIRFMNQSLRED